MSFSLTLALGTLPGVLFGSISGVVADRIDRKKMVVILDILSGLVVIGLLIISIIDEFRLSYIYITTFLLSTCNVFFNTPLSASIPNIVDDENLTRINSLSHTISSSASIVGPFVGGLIYVIVDLRTFLLVNGLSFIISGISEMFITFNVRNKFYNKLDDTNEDEEKNQTDKTSFFIELKEGISYIVSQKWLMVLGTFAVLLNMLIMMGLNVPVPYIIREIWGFSSRQFGFLNMMFPLGILAGSLVLSILPQVKHVYKRLIISIFMFSLVLILVGIITSEILFTLNNTEYLIILMVLYVIIAISTILINVPINVTMQRLIPDKKRGRVIGTLGTLAMALSPLGAIIGGAMVDLIEPWILPMSCGIIILFLTLLMKNVEEINKM